MKRHSHHRRRGVLLLVVLSLLVLFVLAGTTFVVTSGQYRRATASVVQIERTDDPPYKLLDNAITQLIRGTSNKASALLGNSLLEDLYGEDSVVGKVGAPGNVTLVADQNLWRFRFTDVDGDLPGDFMFGFPGPGDFDFHTIDNFYDGCVLTFTSGKLAGVSTRIVDYSFYPGSDGQWGAMSGMLSDAGTGDDEVFVAVRTPLGMALSDLQADDEFLINGRPFNGTGFGFESLPASVATPLDGTDGYVRLLALQPDLSALNPADRDSAKRGGLDESWDAVDYQNPFLAAYAPGATMLSDITPSFHRPDIVDYWFTRESMPPGLLTGVSATDRRERFEYPFGSDRILNTSDDPTDLMPDELIELNTLRRRMTPWPLAEDHPYFRPALTRSLLAPASWDVDNLGDGVPDSIWIDLGMPAKTTTDGRMYKPLFAIVCLDLDGKINVNTMGNWIDVNNNDFVAALNATDVAGGQQPSMNQLGFGLGFGAADVHPTFGDMTTQRVELNKVIDNRHGSALSSDTGFGPGETGVDDGVGLSWDNAGADRDFTDDAYTIYRSPPDLHGRSTVALSHAGQPIWIDAGLSGDHIDDPYEINLVTPSNKDLRFHPNDLERLLRYNDTDAAQLSPRLLDLATSTFSIADNRLRFTTHSMSIPVPYMQLNESQRNGLGSTPEARNSHLLYYVFEQLAGTVPQDGSIQVELEKMLPLELRRGQRMDVNRLFGDGEDNDGNKVVDEPGEVGDRLPSLPPPSIGDARQEFAKNLYCLAMFSRGPLTDADNHIDFDGDNASDADETARGIAQWAVNVVDFRDKDAIMTGFEYDVDPFDGWDPDGNLETDTEPDRAVVWGCERPELLMTETLAFHNRRTQDTDDELPKSKDYQGGDLAVPAPIPDPWEGGFISDTPEKQDGDFDQVFKPEGFFFVELYNPWGVDHELVRTGNPSQHVPPELYFSESGGTLTQDSGGVRLDQTIGGDPTWRLAITDGAFDWKKEPESEANYFNNNDTNIERLVYFASPTTSTGKEFFPSASFVDPVKPGEYMVIGTGRETDPGNPTRRLNYVGNRKVYGRGKRTRRIILQPGGNSPVDVPKATNNNIVPSETFGVVDVNLPSQGPVSTVEPKRGAIVIDQIRNLSGGSEPRHLSVSEPLGGYPNFASAGPHTDPDAIDPTKPYPSPTNSGYFPAFDLPLDLNNSSARIRTALMTNGTTENFKSVYLQRLANPLRPHNPKKNPYLTVDQMRIDITVFNGDEDDTNEGTGPGVAMDGDVRFTSVQRGDRESRVATQTNKNPRTLWSAERSGDPASASSEAFYADNDDAIQNPGEEHVFAFNLHHTLGYLNAGYWPYITDTSSDYFGAPNSSSGNETSSSNLKFAANLVDGASNPEVEHADTFPWLAWNDRPFASAYELLLVPRTSSADLLDGGYNHGDDNYDGNALLSKRLDNLYGIGGTKTAVGPFPHLLNFFNTGLSSIFDLVEVPSRFAGITTWIEPGLGGSNDAAAFDFPEGANNLPSFREPGRINLNTMADSAIWEAINARFPSAAEATTVLDSLRGRPIGSAATASLAPSVLQSNPIVETESSLLRSAVATGQPLFHGDFTLPFNDSNRNAFFYLQGISRLGSQTTNQSNVFAVWITVGYFEVQPWTTDANDANHNVFSEVAPYLSESNGGLPDRDVAHPDGLMLGPELGLDTGEINRHRAFYIIDRSIPVGFEPGKDHNVADTILLRRFIE